MKNKRYLLSCFQNNSVKGRAVFRGGPESPQESEKPKEQKEPPGKDLDNIKDPENAELRDRFAREFAHCKEGNKYVIQSDIYPIGPEVPLIATWIFETDKDGVKVTRINYLEERDKNGQVQIDPASPDYLKSRVSHWSTYKRLYADAIGGFKGLELTLHRNSPYELPAGVPPNIWKNRISFFEKFVTGGKFDIETKREILYLLKAAGDVGVAPWDKKDNIMGFEQVHEPFIFKLTLKNGSSVYFNIKIFPSFTDKDPGPVHK